VHTLLNFSQNTDSKSKHRRSDASSYTRPLDTSSTSELLEVESARVRLSIGVSPAPTSSGCTLRLKWVMTRTPPSSDKECSKVDPGQPMNTWLGCTRSSWQIHGMTRGLNSPRTWASGPVGQWTGSNREQVEDKY
jgi:hypothetical protein